MAKYIPIPFSPAWIATDSYGTYTNMPFSMPDQEFEMSEARLFATMSFSAERTCVSSSPSADSTTIFAPGAIAWSASTSSVCSSYQPSPSLHGGVTGVPGAWTTVICEAASG